MDAINTLTMVTGFRIRPRLPTHGTVEGLLGQHYRTAPQMVDQLESILGDRPEGRRKHNRSRVLRPLRPRPPRLPGPLLARKR